MKMQRQFTSGSRQAPDPCDQFLEENNFYRKHTARDASCLFRVVSEQIYDSQLHHCDIRMKCVDYMRKYHSFFQPLVDQDLNEYLDELSKPKTFGTLVELQAIAYMYKCNVILFQPFDLGSCFIQDNNFNKVIRVFYSLERHFDSVFTCDYIKDIAICQGICYELLYKDIFKLPDVAFAVEQMLYSSSLENFEYDNGQLMCLNGQTFDLDLPQNTKCILENSAMCRFHSTKSLDGSSDESDIDENDWMLPGKNISCVRQLLLEGITPFPYKVAKALDPYMYRNIEFDSWNEARKELKFQSWYCGDSNFKVGAKCHVKLHKSEDDVLYTCHIQEIDGITGQCSVFIEQLGEKRTVPYDSLLPLPIDQFKPWALPYRIQRHLNKLHSFPFAVRNYNYRLKFNEHYASNLKCHINQKQYAAVALSSSSMTTQQNDYFCNMKQYTHLENFRAQTIEYCTMPISIAHDIDMNSNIEGIESSVSSHTLSSVIEKESDQNSEMNDKNNNNTALITPDGKQITSVNEMETEHSNFLPNIPYHYQMPTEESHAYNNIQPTNFVPTNNGGIVYYYNHGVTPFTPLTNNLYMQPSPPFQPHSLLPSTASGPQNYLFSPNQPYPNSTQLVAPPRQVISHFQNASLFREQTNNIANSFGNGQINLDAKKSVKGNGSDLPTDVATLKYFYNLGVDYYQRHMRQSKRVENKENISKKNSDGSQSNDTREIKLDSNNNNMVSSASLNPRHFNSTDTFSSNHKNNTRRCGGMRNTNKERSFQRNNISSNSNFKVHSKSQQRNEIERNQSNKNMINRNYQEQYNCSSYPMQQQTQIEIPIVSTYAGGNDCANTSGIPHAIQNASVDFENSNVENEVQNIGSGNPNSICNDFEQNTDANFVLCNNGPAAPSTMYVQVGHAPYYSGPGMIQSPNGFLHPNFITPLLSNAPLGNENMPAYNDNNIMYPFYNYQPSCPPVVPYYYTPAPASGMQQITGFNAVNNPSIQSNITQPPPPQHQ